MSMEEEATIINFLLLKKMKKLHNKKILLFTDHLYFKDDHDSMFYLYQSDGVQYNLNLIQFKKNRFYERFHQHKSSLGNELIAKIYFNALTGNKDFSLKIIRCHFKEPIPIQTGEIKSIKTGIFKQNSATSINLSRGQKLQSIQITGENIALTTLRPIIDKTNYMGGKSFITFFGESNFLESPFILLDIQLKKGMRIYIELEDKTRIELGSIEPLDISNVFFVFYTKYIENQFFSPYDDDSRLFFLLGKMPFSLKARTERIKSTAKLFVENHELGILYTSSLYGKKGLVLIPVVESLFIGPHGHIREKSLPNDEFSLYIQYNYKNGESFKSLIPNWICKKEKQYIHLNLPNFEPLY